MAGHAGAGPFTRGVRRGRGRTVRATRRPRRRRGGLPHAPIAPSLAPPADRCGGDTGVVLLSTVRQPAGRAPRRVRPRPLRGARDPPRRCRAPACPRRRPCRAQSRGVGASRTPVGRAARRVAARVARRSSVRRRPRRLRPRLDRAARWPRAHADGSPGTGRVAAVDRSGHARRRSRSTGGRRRARAGARFPAGPDAGRAGHDARRGPARARGLRRVGRGR